MSEAHDSAPILWQEAHQDAKHILDALEEWQWMMPQIADYRVTAAQEAMREAVRHLALLDADEHSAQQKSALAKFRAYLQREASHA